MQNVNTKYTAVLPSEHINELKQLASEKFIPSVNYGIKRAVEQYLEQVKKQVYEQHMAEAVKDAAFLTRTLNTEKSFSAICICGVGDK